ncbi:nuclear transport factor 2 family protein [Burkholderia sp. Ac-20353]|uniref:nuclear transport factor 2 family protein n=1 Tax=Burkholderia sp. Ac-20353 TaxID=2703894 RepID=UPI00197C451A|nr:nuclear transport factor 2 family protein [Burkholderia sp. Ac-20353]MBN3788824.1 nuclear transport factor 2 family protein [Burkholderia sp. Ac-20353]
MKTESMTDEQRKAIAIELLRRFDRGESVFDLFDDNAEVFFPKWGVARGKHEIQALYSDLGKILASVSHDLTYANFIQEGDLVVVEGTSRGVLLSGADWKYSAESAGRWCDVLEIRNFKIQRCFVYLDPDYAGADTSRYPWLTGEHVSRECQSFP